MSTSYIACLLGLLTRGLATHSHWRLYNEKGVKEREVVNETPRREGLLCVVVLSSLAWLSFYNCLSGLGPDARNLSFFDIFDIFWICFACNHIFLRFLDILDIFWIFFSLTHSFISIVLVIFTFIYFFIFYLFDDWKYTITLYGYFFFLNLN